MELRGLILSRQEHPQQGGHSSSNLIQGPWWNRFSNKHARLDVLPPAADDQAKVSNLFY